MKKTREGPIVQFIKKHVVNMILNQKFMINFLRVDPIRHFTVGHRGAMQFVGPRCRKNQSFKGRLVVSIGGG